MVTTHEKPVDVSLVACEVCLKEVPQSEAAVPEAVDYVVYFCGIDCYRQWKAQATAVGKDGSVSDLQTRSAEASKSGG